METNYPRCLANTLNEEGGWTNDPRDPGGPTMYGIIQREYTKYRREKGLYDQSVRYISQQELQDIYRGNYWAPVVGPLWPKGSDQIVFDIAVNAGLGRANRIMAYALRTNELDYTKLAARATSFTDRVGIVQRACDRRASFYRGLRTFGVFGRGWLARNARMEAIGVRMALEADNVRDVAGQLRQDGKAAAQKSKRAGQGAAGTGTGTAAGGASATQLDVSSWDWSSWLLVGLSVAAAVALVIYLVWLWQKHGEKAKAYALAAEGKLEVSFNDILMRIKGSRLI